MFQVDLIGVLSDALPYDWLHLQGHHLVWVLGHEFTQLIPQLEKRWKIDDTSDDGLHSSSHKE